MTSVLLSSCSLSPTPEKADDVHAVFDAEQKKSEQRSKLVIPDAVSHDLLSVGNTSLDTSNLEERFNVAANGVPLKLFLQGMTEDTPYSIAYHPEVTASISLDLKDVTIGEVIDLLNTLYPVDIQFRGKVIQAFPAYTKTETIDINYLMLKRYGTTSTNISSGGLVESSSSSGTTDNDTSTDSSSTDSSNSNSNSSSNQNSNGSSIKTTSETDYWTELEDTLNMIMESNSGSNSSSKNVVVSPQSGLVTVRGLPSDIQVVKDFIKRSEKNLTRQVILEAKIVEVTLNDDYQQGINWQNVLSSSSGTDFSFSTGAGVFSNTITASLGGVSNLSFSNVDFSGVVNLLETQGNVQVLSSPRVTATNNQKAVIKVGEDEYFVTDVDLSTTVSGTSTTSTPSIELEAFFSGIALDVTPQINDKGEVILHVHPSVTETEEQEKVIILNEEQYVLPLAQSNIRESDTVIRAKSGEIVVIGGLMQTVSTDYESRVPFLGAIPWLGELFKTKQESRTKKELVILIKPTVVGTGTWQEQLNRSSDLLKRWYGD